MKSLTYSSVLSLTFLINASPLTVLRDNHQERINSGWKVITNSLDFFRYPEDYSAKENVHMFCQKAGDILTFPVNCDEPINPDSTAAGMIDSSKPTVFLLHGYMGHSKKSWIGSMALRLHRYMNVNVCFPDWSMLAALELNLSVLKLRDVGQRIAQCTRSLIGEGERELNEVTLVGYGLGAHLAGCVGKNLSGQVGRIFGLDPLIEFSEELLSSDFRLVASDARLVQVAHTSIGAFGAYRPSGHQDFYFNDGGRSPQPGCSHFTDEQQGVCSHFRAIELMFHSLNKTNKFFDEKGQERFGFYTKGRMGRYLVKTGSKPPYSK